LPVASKVVMAELGKLLEDLKMNSEMLEKQTAKAIKMLSDIANAVKACKIIDITIIDRVAFKEDSDNLYYIALKDGSLAIYVFHKKKQDGAYAPFIVTDPVTIAAIATRLPEFLRYVNERVTTKLAIFEEALNALENVKKVLNLA